MGRSDQLFGIGAGRVLEACREAIRLVGEHARLGRDTAFAFLAEAFVARGCGACDHLSPPAGVAGRERPKPLKVRSSARDRRSEERREGKECVSTWRARWSTENRKKKHEKSNKLKN